MSTQQNIPHKPDYLSDTDWAYVVQRDKHRCALWDICQRTGRAPPCDINLDIDHYQPRELGGDDSFDNARLLCRGPNRGRISDPRPKWKGRNYWDNKLLEAGLRQIQLIAGPQAVEEALMQSGIAPRDMRKMLLPAITLMPGATGIGKTLQMQATFFKFNALVGVGFPRINRVLWLTNETGLRDMGANEIKEDPVERGIVRVKMHDVGIARGWGDLVRGHQGRPVTVSTTQALFLADKADGKRRSADDERLVRHSDDERRTVLAQFDTIVFDEADWASNPQVQSIADLASHALKFALTATPPIPPLVNFDGVRAGNFRKRFVMITSDAVADYDRAQRLDGCLKIVTAPRVGIPHKGFDGLREGLPYTSSERAQRDHAVYRSLILQTIQEADDFETRMRHIEPEDYYSPHVLVRIDGINNIKLMFHELRIALQEMVSNGVLKNPGWDVTAIFQGHERALRDHISPSEYDLAARKDERYLHPFMRAKDHDGQCRPRDGNKRVLLHDSIGVRGMNNWPITFIVDCTDHVSPAELTQEKGRAIRWPNTRVDWFDRLGLREFTETHYIIPDNSIPGLEEETITDRKHAALLVAKDFIERMVEYFGKAGFLSWPDLFSGRRLESVVLGDTVDRQLTKPEKYEMQDVLAQELEEHGSLNLDVLDDIIKTRYPDIGEPLQTRLREYGERLVSEPAFRDFELNATGYFDQYHSEPECVIDRLQPVDDYPVDLLKAWITHEPDFRNLDLQELHKRIDAGDAITLHFVSDKLRTKQKENYRGTARVYVLQGPVNPPEKRGALRQVAAELAEELHRAEQAPGDKESTPRYVSRAAMEIFAIDNAADKGPMDHAAYHVAILGRLRRPIQAMARALMIREGILGPRLARFADYSQPQRDEAAE